MTFLELAHVDAGAVDVELNRALVYRVDARAGA
jgi:hypothetical protein